jgi:cytoskeletal protein CcmA (bactofilin family)
MLVIGIINPTGVTPSFVIPLFQESDKLYIQRLDESERIRGFERIYLSDEAEDNTLRLNARQRRQVEDERLYGFQFKNNDFVVGTKSELRQTLIERLDEVESSKRPFILISIAEFVGDASLRASAQSRAYALLNSESPSAGERWRYSFGRTEHDLAEDAFREANRRDSSRTRVIAAFPKNSLANDVEVKGSIRFVNELIFDGKLEGEMTSDGILTIGESGDVHGEVKAKSVIVMGKVQGNITVSERCELRSRSQLIGDLRAARLIIEEGATFVGKSEVSPNKGMLKELGAREKPHEVGSTIEEG